MKLVIDFKTFANRWQRYGEEYVSEGRKNYSDFTKHLLSLSTSLTQSVYSWIMTHAIYLIMVPSYMILEEKYQTQVWEDYVVLEQNFQENIVE